MFRSYIVAVRVLLSLVVVTLVSPARTMAQADGREAWSTVNQLPNDRAPQAAGIRARKFKGLQLNHGQLKTLLATAPDEKQNVGRGAMPVIALPMPDGTFARFRFVESSVMASELAAKFPEIKTYLGEGIDDPKASVRFDVTPAGFHAQILSPHGAVYIDPAFRGENGLHTSYYKRDYVRAEDFQCLVPEDAGTAGRSAPASGLNSVTPMDLARSGGNLRTYRLAVAATGEYVAYHGGTLSAGMSAIVTAVNRVVGVYETELAIRMVLVANNDLVVYTNSSTDPFSNGTPSSLLTQNQSTMDSIIGSGSYDIGHVFSTAGGGLAGLGVVCIGGQKARGETGTSAPIGDAFYIDYVAHEMGHQFGGNHTFNSSVSNCGGGNRNAATAYEQGSGSTIMAYAGICGSDDLQPHSDPYFHSISFDEILNYSTAGSGNSCAVITATGNNAPNISAGANYTIPQNTPFTLTVASASDPNGDPLTFCWEERDLGASTTVTAGDNGSSPLFRSWNPTTNLSRTFPRLQNLLNNTLPLGEVMPTTTRTMTFRVTARDNRAGGGGVNTSDMQVNVTAAAGPFLVTSHNSGGTFSGMQTVTWNVAGTAAAPVNSPNVNILLSTDGGLTFPITLLSNTPNDGSQVVLLPNINTATARIKIEGAGNIFFDVCNSNFTIVPGIPTPVVFLETTALTGENCGATNGAIDPGETVTFNVVLRNTGSADTTNLVATLLVTNGVTAPSGPQNYGALLVGGPAVNRTFSFTASGSCGGSITAILQLQDGAVNLGTVTKTFGLGAVASTITRGTNSANINIPGIGTKGAGAPFPSTISIVGVTGTVAKVTVTLVGFNHSFPADVDALLVGPSGQTLLLMSDAGGGNSASGLTLVFDDEASAVLSDTAALTSGTFKPSNYGAGDTFSSPAPGGTYGTMLSVFNGLNPNGTWSLYLQDDSSQDTGSIAQGWQLAVITSNTVCCVGSPVSELAMGMVASTNSLNVGDGVTFTLTVTNLGPNSAANVVITNVLPPGVNFVSAATTQGSWTNIAGLTVFSLGTLTSNGVATMIVQATASNGGIWTNTASVSCSTLDPILTNNFAMTFIVANAVPTLSNIGDTAIDEDGVLGPMNFTIGDAETPAVSLMVTVQSGNTNVISSTGLSLSGSGSNRSLTITPVTNAFGTATITVSVTDGQATNSGSFLVTVNPINDAPELVAITNYVLVEGQVLTFANAATDVETPLNLLTFSLQSAPINAGVNPTNGTFLWTTGEADGPSTNVISVVVADNGVPSLTATQTFTVVVLETNSAPILAPITNFTIVEGATLAFTNVAIDVDVPTNVLTFTLANAPTNASIDAAGVFTWVTTEADGPGTNMISVVVTDSGVPSLTATQTFTVFVIETNAAPVLAGIPDYMIYEGETIAFTNAASDSDFPTNTLTFSVMNAPTNAVFNTISGGFIWTPNELQGPGTNHISVVVSDNGSPSLSATQSFTVIVIETNSAPSLAAITDQKIHAGMTLNITNVATDLDWPPNLLTYSLDSAPTNSSIDFTNGFLTWTPLESDVDTVQSVTVRVTDDGQPQLADTKTFLVTVVSRPVITIINVISNSVDVTWTSLAGHKYHLQQTTNLNETSWINLPDVTASGPTATQTNVVDTSISRLFRVKVVR